MSIDIDRLYKRWVSQYGEKRVVLTYPSLRGLYSWFLRQSADYGIDPASIDFESLVDPTLVYSENQIEFKKYFPSIPVPEKPEALTKEELEKALAMYEEEANTIKKELGLPLTPIARIEELGDKLTESETKLSRTREQLKKTKEEVTRLEAEMAKAKAKPPPMPKIGEEALTEREVQLIKEDFLLILSKANIYSPEIYLTELDKAIDRKKSPAENIKIYSDLAQRIIKRTEKERPKPTITPEIESRIKSLEEMVGRISRASGVAGARQPRMVEVEDWHSHEIIEVDEDEVFRLRILLYDKAKMVHPKYFLISPDSQLQTYGYTSSGMIKSAIAHGLINIAQIRQVGLDPKAYGITGPEA